MQYALDYYYIDLSSHAYTINSAPDTTSNRGVYTSSCSL